uniref:Response regulatory domain-containing protein n=2 Tax=Lotharella globosa TaxID=91324 RepID=A0A7S3YU82_9EUKA
MENLKSNITMILFFNEMSLLTGNIMHIVLVEESWVEYAQIAFGLCSAVLTLMMLSKVHTGWISLVLSMLECAQSAIYDYATVGPDSPSFNTLSFSRNQAFRVVQLQRCTRGVARSLTYACIWEDMDFNFLAVSIFIQQVSPSIAKYFFLEVDWTREPIHPCLPVSKILLGAAMDIVVALTIIRTISAIRNSIRAKRNVETSILHHGMKNTFAAICSGGEVLMDDMEKDYVDQRHIKEAQRLCRISRVGMIMCNSKRSVAHILQSDYKEPPRVIKCVDMLEPLSCFSRRIVLPKTDKSVRAVGDHLAMNIILENAVNNACRHGDQRRKISLVGVKQGDYVVIQVANVLPPRVHFGVLFSIKMAAMHGCYNFDSRPFIGNVQELLLSRAVDREMPTEKFLSEGKGVKIIKDIAKKFGYGVDMRASGRIAAFRLVLPSATHRGIKNNNSAKMTPTPGSQHWARKPKSLKIACVEDSPMIIKLYERILLKRYFAEGSIVVGRCIEELERIAERITDGGFHGCILDQNLVYGERCVLGTSIVKQCRRMGYDGLVIMRSANTEPEDIEKYIEAGADSVIGKHVNVKEIYATFVNEFVKKFPECSPASITSQTNRFQQNVKLHEVKSSSGYSANHTRRNVRCATSPRHLLSNSHTSTSKRARLRR